LADEYRSYASLDGIDLEIENIEDSFEKAIAVNEIPYRDGALTDDLGLKARRIKFRCYFYEEGYDSHKDLLNHLRQRELVELIHPKYGLLKGRVESVSVRHDDRIRTAEIDISFVEHLRASFEGARRRPEVMGEAQDAFERGVVQLKDDFKNSSIAEIGTEATGICDKILVAGQSALSQFTGLSRQAQQYVKEVDAFVAGLESSLITIANPANSFIATIDFGLNLPGRVVGAIARTAERYGLLFSSLSTMPEKFLVNLRDSMYDLGNATGFGGMIQHGSSLHASLSLAAIFSDDEDKRDLARSLEQSASFDAAGNYVKPEPTPELLDVAAIEKSLAVVNGMIDDAIAVSRSMSSLKDMARILTEHAVTVKLESEKLVTEYVDNETPLHLLCLQRGLPYNYAERLIRINSIPNPNQVKGEVLLYVG